MKKYRGSYEQAANWNTYIRRSYWMLGLLFLLSVIGMLPFRIADEAHLLDAMLPWKILIQGVLLLLLQLTAEWVCRQHSRFQDYYILAIGSCFSGIILAAHTSSEIHAIQVVLILPILISIMYFNYTKVLYSCLVTFVMYALVLMINPMYRTELALGQKLLGLMLILLTTLAAIGIVNRGLKLMKQEKRALLNEARHRLQEEVMSEACQRDALTGLGNHMAFQEKIGLLIKETSNRPMHLAMVDLDNFKAVNDTFGHWAGDQVLNRMGFLLKEWSTDRMIASRYGGEEFSIIFIHMEADEVREELERLRCKVEQFRYPELSDGGVTISIGCRQLTEGEDRESLFQRADEALYQAKRDGKNRVA